MITALKKMFRAKYMMPFVLLMMVACTVQRRQHLPGFYVERLHFSGDNTVAHAKLTDSTGSIRIAAQREAADEEILGEESIEKTIVPVQHVSTGNEEEQAENYVPEPVKTEAVTSTKELVKAPVETTRQNVVATKSNEESGDSLLYGMTAVIAGLTLSMLALFRKPLLNLTRWAKNNPQKTKALIGGTHVTLLGLALYSGYNLEKMGYDISTQSTLISGGLMGLGFFLVPFRIKRDSIAIPRIVKLRRLVYLGMIGASFMMVMGYGNRMEEQHPYSPVTKAVQHIDESIFGAGETVAADENHPGMEIKRHYASGGIIVAAVVLFILLIATLCASICLIIGAFGGFFAAGVAVLAVVGGLIGAALSVWGMISVVKWANKSQGKE